jgi:diadenosine tetraphosphate (Ap4A) HIT family hydrolase
MTFVLDPAFEETSDLLCDLTLCEARLQLDGRYGWVVLIPRRADMRELEELSMAERLVLLEEIVLASQAVRAISDAIGLPTEKLNVGSLGNVTAQLHVHIVSRRSDDAAWPGPVWGHSPAAPYSPELLAKARAGALAVFEEAGFFSAA